MEAKSTERRTSGREPDTEKKEPKGTGGKDQADDYNYAVAA
jgi:hypothetical protein